MPYKDRLERLAYHRKYYKVNRKKMLADCKIYQSENKLKLKIYTRRYRIRQPWLTSYMSAEQRCNNKKHHAYHRYGGRGIKFMLTKEQVKYLYERDFACMMKWATIDRINNDGNYELQNCRFIEMSDNSKRKKSK